MYTPRVVKIRILYQRGIYPPESFNRVSKYGLSMVVAHDDKLRSYITNMINQVRCTLRNCFSLLVWLESNDLHMLVLVIYGLNSQKVLERWSFGVETDREVAESNGAV